MLAAECLFNLICERQSDYDTHYITEPQQDSDWRIDKWLLASLLQKAIRRSDLKLAREAGHQLLAMDGARLWRRLMATAMEDIGIGAPQTAAEIVAIAALPEARKLLGHRALDIALILACEAVKDRTADHFHSVLKHVPLLEPTPTLLREASQTTRLAVISTNEQPWMRRLCAVHLYHDHAGRSGAELALFDVFEELGVPNIFIAAAKLYQRRNRDALGFYACLAYCFWQTNGSLETVCIKPKPDHAVIAGIPDYAFDPLHTRLGQRAVQLWLKSYLAKPAFTARQIAIALWNQESAFVSRSLRWPNGHEIQMHGENADLCARGLAPVSHSALRTFLTNEISVLRCVRQAVYESETRAAAAALPPGASAPPNRNFALTYAFHESR